MAKPSPLNPLYYIIKRQYNDTICIKNKIFKERLAKARNLYRKDLLAHYGCVNAIEFSNEGDLLVSGGDDRRVLLWSVPEAMFGQGSPAVMETNHNSNIFCLGFDSCNTKIFSGGNDDQVIIHDAITGNLVGKLPHKKPVYGLSLNPLNDSVIATAGDDGRILLFDVRESPNTECLCLAKQKTGFHSVMFNPTNPRWLVTANSDEGIALWDARKPRELLIHYDANAGQISGISACFNSNGDRVLALRRRLPPVLYSTQKESAICQFYHPQYYNSCTMKTCCFAGANDEYVLSGSDDFNLYMWRMPTDESMEWGKSHLVLKGHRSIVNQVRYNKEINLIASSGVEKMVKLWSCLPIGTWKGSLQKEHADASRSVYTHEDYIYLVGHSGERISHDYSDHSTQEDSKMMAFFDSLIQREIEGWETSENSDYTDSDSDENAKSLSNILNEMFSNGKLPPDENKKHKSNRIAQLIAKKRAKLARMAHEKSTSSILGSFMKEKNNKKKKGSNSSQKLKTSKYKKHNCSSTTITTTTNTTTTVAPTTTINSHKKNFTKQQQKFNGGLNNNNNNSSNNIKLRKYRTRQSMRELCEESGGSNNSFDAPSTSTGITSSSNSSVYRVIEQDSDEEVPSTHHHHHNNNNHNNNNNNNNNNHNSCNERNHNSSSEENNFVNILPTPLNGTHDMYINVLEMSSNVDVEDDAGSSEQIVEHVASTSNGGSVAVTRSNRIRRASCSIDELILENNKNCSIGNGTERGDGGGGSESDSDYEEYEYRTPIKKRRRRVSGASDSGCGTGPCSSTSPYPIRNSRNYQECSSINELYNNEDLSSDDELINNYVKFRKSAHKLRMNIRKHFGGPDSDTN